MKANSRSNIHFGRIYVVVAGLILFFIILEMQLFRIQVKQHDFYLKQSQIQSAKKIALPAQRGIIYDRNHEELATNIIHYDLGIDLNQVKNRAAIAKAFSSIFGKSANYYLRKMKRNRDFAYLERKVPESFVQSLKMISDPGFVKIKGFRRFYPYRQYGSQLIGFTNIDDKGIAGLELQYEKYLRGESGWTFLLADARRRFGYHVDFPQVLPKSGSNLYLTIDKNIQTIVDDELAKGVRKNNANFGIAVLMNPNTGEILAMSSYPGFNLNSAGRSTPDQRRNRAIADIFEPGSTFKVFPAAALLQENLKKPHDIVFCENGSYKFYDHVVHDTRQYAWLSFKKVIENSSNIGMVKLTRDLPQHKFYRYLKNFGFASLTGINLIGEESGILSKPDKFSGISKGIISFGQEIGVTAIQIVNAFSAIVNGGNLMRPFVIHKIVTNDNDIIELNRPFVIRQVVSEDVSGHLKSFMLDAVRRGTGKKVNISKTLMGGKTGTAQKFNFKTKRYKRNAHLSSFIGFAPYESPEYVLGIFIDEPTPAYYGGDVAAPVFSSIMQRLIDFTPAHRPESDDQIQIVNKNTDIPDMRGLTLAAAEEYFLMNDISYQIAGDGTHIIAQKDHDGEIHISLGYPDLRMQRVPDLKGLTVREALKTINFSLYRVVISGNGKIIKQHPRPGTMIKGRQTLQLTCAESS